MLRRRCIQQSAKGKPVGTYREKADFTKKADVTLLNEFYKKETLDVGRKNTRKALGMINVQGFSQPAKYLFLKKDRMKGVDSVGVGIMGLLKCGNVVIPFDNQFRKDTVDRLQ